MKKLWSVLLILVGLAIYLNIGFHLGTYRYENSIYVVSETFWGHFWAGGWDFLSDTHTPPLWRDAPMRTLVLSSLFWPLILVLVLVSWIVFAIYAILSWIWGLNLFVVWCIFQGGIGYLLASPGASPILIVVLLLLWILIMIAASMDAKRTKETLASAFVIVVLLLGISLLI